jgi:predicted CoA-substrate-specific enzyme activase
MIFAGIDAGSRAIKTILIDENGKVLASGLTDQGVKQAELAAELLERTVAEAGARPESVLTAFATGYGRDALDFVDSVVTEITCHAKGVIHQKPEAKTIIDIGGQDSKVIRMGTDGAVRDFVMNDRCAAGTGRFLEVLAERLEMDIRELGTSARRADKPSAISNTCVVFAETEILGLLTSGERRDNIVAGVQASIASRIATMAGRHIEEPVILTGGVALIPEMSRFLESAIGRPVTVAENPQMTGAMGAALLASRWWKASRA